MKLIVDAQLPVKLCEILNQLGLNSMHVDELPQGDETPDAEITEFADLENLIVVTKDFDFYHSYMTKEAEEAVPNHHWKSEKQTII